MTEITALTIKPVKKGEARSVETMNLIADFGPEGDAYGGPGDRQITLLGEEDLKALEKDRVKGLCIHRFTPNITLSGSTTGLNNGQKYRLGNAEITITSVRKVCHEGCAIIEEEKRICLLPKAARFASIQSDGVISVGDEVISS